MNEANETQRKILQAYTNEKLIWLKNEIEQVSVVCFSKKLDNTLMWSHYAKNHTGLCFTYEIPPEFILKNSPQIIGWDEVKYENEEIKKFFLSFIPNKDANEFECFIEPLITRILSTKSEAWSYEKEFRIVKSEPGKFDIDRKCLKQICFGLATTHEHIDLIKKIISNHGYSDVTFFKMTRTNDHDFGFEAQAI